MSVFAVLAARPFILVAGNRRNTTQLVGMVADVAGWLLIRPAAELHGHTPSVLDTTRRRYDCRWGSVKHLNPATAVKGRKVRMATVFSHGMSSASLVVRALVRRISRARW
jgi:hypothetical protein